MDYLSNEVISGINLYSYCGNDPVNYYDPSGHITLTAIIIIGLIGFGTLIVFGIVAKIILKMTECLMEMLARKHMLVD